MKSKKQHHEEHPDETWLLPYSDMLTLLLALFIVMFAMSKVDTEKFKKLSQQFNVIFSGGTGIMNEGGGNSGVVLPVDTSKKSNSTIEQDAMTEIRNKLNKQIRSAGYQDKIGVNLNGEGLSIAIQDTVIFNPEEATIISKFNPVLVQISNMIKRLDNDIRVSGHTDNVPIISTKFRSNFDLSYMRASNVMNLMVGDGHLKPDRFSIQAYGEYKPKYSNSTEVGRAKNRRVDILIVRKY